MSDSESTSGHYSNSAAYANNASIVELRLNPSEIHRQVEMFLRGRYESYSNDPSTRVLTHKVEQSVKPLLNEEGIRRVMLIVTMGINTQTVQGNFKEEWYFRHVGQIRIDLATELFTMQPNVDLRDEDIEYIINNIMRIVEPYYTRLIGDGERKSYVGFESREERRVENKGGFFSSFFGGNK